MFGLASLTLGKNRRMLNTPQFSALPTFQERNLFFHRLMRLLVGLETAINNDDFSHHKTI
jgi:hypothetical protein